MTLTLWSSWLNNPLIFDTSWVNITFSLIGVLNADLEMIWTEQIVAHVWNYNMHILELREGMFYQHMASTAEKRAL